MDNQRELISEEMEQITGGVNTRNFEQKNISKGKEPKNFEWHRCPDCGHVLHENDCCLNCCIEWYKS